MADTDQSKTEASAEKAYAAAAEAAGVPAAPEAPKAAEPDILEEATGPVEFPAKPKRAAKPPEAESKPATKSEPAPAPAIVAAPATEPKVSRPGDVKPAKVEATAKTVATPKVAVKPAAAKPTPTPKNTVAPKEAPSKPLPENNKPEPGKTTPKSAEASAPAAPKSSFIAQLKEFPMDVSTTIKDAVDGAQAKAKEALSKTSAAAGEYTDFAKGNVEALVESGKIIAVGLQEIGNQAVAESKTAFETLVSDAKALSSVKSPVDFFKLQTELLRRNIDHAVAYGSKTSESMIKLTSDAIAPISGRVSLAIEKVKKAA